MSLPRRQFVMVVVTEHNNSIQMTHSCKEGMNPQGKGENIEWCNCKHVHNPIRKRRHFLMKIGKIVPIEE